ncbi:MAG TPA: multiheme c-type cytochrome, partial [Terriglobales bacterium]
MATRISIGKLAGALAAVLSITGLYLYGWPAPSLPYIGTVLFHTGIGLLFLLLGMFLLRYIRQQGVLCIAASAVLALAGILGIALMFVGATRPMYPLLFAHIAASVLGVVLLAAWWMGKRKSAPAWRYAALLVVVAVALGALSQYSRKSWSKQYQIHNPNEAPLTMDGEGDGPTGMFFPSSAQVAGKRKIPSKFFMESDACQRCHSDIYKQWESSMHHMSSFNNQWYRKSVEYMQDVRGVKPSKWCGGCHDPAVLYSGLMDTPIKQIVHRPESQAGLGCMMCHSIVKVKSTMGQADFMLEYPELHELAATKNPVMRWLHDFTIYLNPEPHRRVFLKPFMRNEQSPEFCSSCHKVHLDVPVNAYRWFRGFNEYDNWQASGVSGFGARSFYYPAKAQQCVDCHMPMVPSSDAGNVDGKVHSHSFPGANTAIPFANHDEAQLKLEQDFLKNGNLSVDIFAMSRVAAIKNAAQQSTDLSTTFAVGEEAEVKTNAVGPQEAIPVTAPLNETNPSVRPGDSVRIDVVVRTKKVGHFFPGGTVDAYDTWVELKAVDETGKTLFWSGSVEDGGKGPVEKGAHFYKSLQIDEHGNQINKRNAWSTRAVAYVHLIPPGAADTVHYRLNVPANLTAKKITLSARLLYRKFSWYNTQFSFAGTTDEAPVA